MRWNGGGQTYAKNLHTLFTKEWWCVIRPILKDGGYGGTSWRPNSRTTPTSKSGFKDGSKAKMT